MKLDVLSSPDVTKKDPLRNVGILSSVFVEDSIGKGERPKTFKITRDIVKNCYTCDSCQYRFYKDGEEGITCLRYDFFFRIQTFPSTRGLVCGQWYKKKNRGL